MQIFPDGVIFRERDNLVLNPAVQNLFDEVELLKSTPFITVLDELKDGNGGEVIVMKPSTRFLRLEKRNVDHRDYIYVINNTEKRRREVLVAVFMRIIFDKLKNSFEDLNKFQVSEERNSDFRYELALAENLVDQLFYFSAQNTGPLRLVTSKTDLSALALEIENLINSFGLADAESLSVSVEDNIPRIRLDRCKMRDVLITLICNALAYSEDQGKVFLTFRYDELGFHISVRDQGRGIPAESMEKIFNKYYHVDRMINSGHDANRLSIGLPYVRYIVEAHGGTVTISNPPHRGTSFDITLPATLIADESLRENSTEDSDILQKISEKVLDLEFPAREGYLRKVDSKIEAFLSNVLESEEIRCSVSLVIAESLSNAIMHGPKGSTDTVRLIICIESGGIIFAVRDCGGKFFYPSFFEKLARDRGMKAGGRGIFFIKHFMEEIAYIINDNVSTWVLMYKAL
ncbi:MAG: hypothetical protein CVV64_08290 [Candidatus Wallbacteria bacterium HGW-Wallbacteria-1]|jgi:anti-sigma regulatory factor (Ser/Thr protein kinase)|uniref:histidine kinase n=1 Tax=Candidatus Wallbacteria bacterium HGW-Wallbacteria-1 TaxID=2013854 RepID=A0A2N1PR99_9BACT|nr:MAG: hypothetical protein CVV64_08290 [Candidatus Wallbacteria bacterium HGW-Wallbacteria-1]